MNSDPTKLERISGRVNRMIEMLLFGLGASMALVVALQVLFRYGLNQSLFWSEELARFFLVWLTFLGATVAYFRRLHPGVDVLYHRCPPTLRQAADVLVHSVSLLLFLVMVVYGWRFAHFVRLQITPALNLPKWVVFGIVPLSGLVLTLHALPRLIAAATGTHRDH
jgi:TRAP-type C4-dicarboxylate transport system permease small subunit